jgi:hypothetical protein
MNAMNRKDRKDSLRPQRNFLRKDGIKRAAIKSSFLDIFNYGKKFVEMSL